MIASKSINIFAAAAREDMFDLIKNYSGIEDKKDTSLSNNLGEINIPMKVSSIENIQKIEAHNYDDRDEFNELNKLYSKRDLDMIFNSKLYLLNYKNIIDDIEEEIIKIECNENILKEFLLNIYNDDLSKLYGVMLSYGGKRINPLHPITAQMIVDGHIEIPKEFQLIVYSYIESKSSNYKNIDDNYIEKIMNILSRIKKNFYRTKGLSKYRGRDPKRISLDSEYVSNIRFRFDITEESRPEYSITPIQFMTKDIIIPYYGAISSFTDGGDYKSLDLFPMLSGNLELNYRNYKFYKNTCTGEESNFLFSSLNNMNNMNCYSLYYKNTLDPNWRSWVDTCISTSIYILYKDDIENSINDEEKITYEEREKELRSLSRKEIYKIISLKHKLKGQSKGAKDALIRKILSIEYKVDYSDLPPYGPIYDLTDDNLLETIRNDNNRRRM